MTELHKIAFDYRNAVLPDDAHEAWIELENYVKQLINDEREACAAVCDNQMEWGIISPQMKVSAGNCADLIRARGQA